MKKIAIQTLLGVTISLFSAFSGKPEHQRMKPFDWLRGSWFSPRKTGKMEERWAVVNDSSMRAVSVIHRPDGKTDPFETVDLVCRGGAFFYNVTSAKENGGAMVSFRLSAFTDSGFVAENPSHDFPKRIIYRRISHDSLLAIIDGGKEAPEERVEFPFKRH